MSPGPRETTVEEALVLRAVARLRSVRAELREVTAERTRLHAAAHAQNQRVFDLETEEAVASEALRKLIDVSS